MEQADHLFKIALSEDHKKATDGGGSVADLVGGDNPAGAAELEDDLYAQIAAERLSVVAGSAWAG